MAKKKNSTYYLCQQTKPKPILNTSDLELQDLKSHNIVFIEDLVNGEVVSSTVIPTDYSIYDKKLTDLLESIIFNDEFWESDEDFEEKIDEDENYEGVSLNNVIDNLIEGFMILRFDNKDKKYTIFTKEQIKNTIDQIFENDIMTLNDDNGVDYNIISTLEDDVVNSLTENVNFFINDTIPNCLGKFTEGSISVDTLFKREFWNFKLNNDKKEIIFGSNDYENAVFKAKMYEYLCFEKIGVVVAVKSDSKFGKDGYYYEQYGFVFDMGSIGQIPAQKLMEINKEDIGKNKKNGFVFCDVDGNRIIGD
jgi:hypothetical protein